MTELTKSMARIKRKMTKAIDKYQVHCGQDEHVAVAVNCAHEAHEMIKENLKAFYNLGWQDLERGERRLM